MSIDILFTLIIFISMFIFFSFAHPLVIFDGDDWFNLSAIRIPLPIWKVWNPIKILPETLFPIVGIIAAYIIKPFCGIGYIDAITYTSAFFVSLFIALYVFTFKKLIEKVSDGDIPLSTAVAIIFLLVHFIIFKKQANNNLYLFHDVNLTCYYHYLIPDLLNCSLVMFFMIIDIRDFWVELKQKNSVVLGTLCLIPYLAICSNILSNIILVSFISGKLLQNFLRENITNNFANKKNFFQKNILYFSIIIFWLITLLFEANGGRARQIGNSTLSFQIIPAINSLKGLLVQSYTPCIVFILGVIVCGFAYYFIKKQREQIDINYKNTMLLLLWCLAITTIYLVIIDAKAGPGYIARPTGAYGVFFFLLIMSFTSVVYILKKIPILSYLLPFVIFILIAIAINPYKSFKYSTVRRNNPVNCRALDYYLIEQIQKADKDGLKEMTLVVPKGDNKNNWPHNINMRDNISRTLFMHGIITKPIKIKIKPDIELNKKFNLN